MLKDIEIWRASKAIYDEEALGNKNADTQQQNCRIHERCGQHIFAQVPPVLDGAADRQPGQGNNRRRDAKRDEKGAQTPGPAVT